MTKWLADGVAILIVALVVGWLGIQYGQQSRARADEMPGTHLQGVSVAVATLRAGSMAPLVVGFGEVTPAPGSIHSYSLPVETIIDAVGVVSGESVEVGRTLVRVSLSAGGALALRQARAEALSAAEAHELARRRLELQLGSKAEVARTRAAMLQANAVLESLEASGLIDSTVLVAAESGIVTSIPWTPGDLVAAGRPLVELAPLERLQATIWVEPEDARSLAVGARVRLTRVGVGQLRGTLGKVTKISSEVDPAIRLVRIAATLGAGDRLLGEYLRCELELRVRTGLLAPRSVLVVDGDSLAVFEIVDGVARERQVKLVGESGDGVLLEGTSLSAGVSLAVSGVAGLSDGVRVSLEP